MLICSLSNAPTANPALSLKSHCIFDAKALNTYVKTNGRDPVSHEPMDESDIISISPSTAKIPNSEEIASPTYSSIPTMLSAFQSAWDSLSLELFQLRTELDKTRKELSLALYRQDAAVKVAVGACKERDEARQALAKLIDGSNGASIVTEEPVDEGNGTPPNDVVMGAVEEEIQGEDWTDFADTLRSEQEALLVKHKKENKERKGKSPIFAIDDLSNLGITLDKKESLSTKKTGDIRMVLPNEVGDECIVVFGSGLFELVDVSRTAKRMKVISKVTVKVAPGEDTPLLAFWLNKEPYVVSKTPAQRGRKSKTSKSHAYQLTNLTTKESKPLATELEGISIVNAHPTLPVFIVANTNEFEVFYKDTTMYSQQLNGELQQIKFHPDGLLVALSYKEEAGVDIYDLLERSIKLNIAFPAHQDVQFASNGYYLFIGGPKTLALFDLRKNDFVQQEGIAGENGDVILVDVFTSLVVYGNKYAVFDKKGKTWEKISELQGLQNDGNACRVVAILNDAEADNAYTLLVASENAHDGGDLFKVAGFDSKAE